MTTRGIRLRTPRKKKVWANESSLATGLSLVANTNQVAVNLLDDYQADIGVTRLQGVTSMRIVGFIAIGNTFGSTGAGNVAVTWGLAWVQGQIAAAGSGDAQIPDPAEQGERETLWIMRGTLLGEADVSGSAATYASKGALGARVEIDSKQMRRQPTPSHELVLITGNVAPSGTVPTINYQFQTLLALP